MKILLSGASSFTGYWFGKTLSAAGHKVTGSYRRGSAADYDGTRARRVSLFRDFGDQAFDCTFGETRFLELASSDSWDVYCHHASEVRNYRSSAFDALAATRTNTNNLPTVLRTLVDRGCHRIVVTGSIFERGEGRGSDGLPAISRYGLSKTLSWEVFLFECRQLDLHLGKFVIPNPFGPLEEERFTHYLATTWRRGESATCQAPLYVRDNIPVDLLAFKYTRYLESLPGELSRCQPSGYVVTQGQFTERIAREFRKRTGWKCDLTPTEQSDFAQPMVRVNSEAGLCHHPEWDESNFWDQMTAFYSAGSIR